MRRSDVGAILAVAAIASLALAGCASGSSTPPPAPSSVEPAMAYAGSDTPVVIRGSGFRVKAVVDVGATARVDAAYRAWLGGVELLDVQWVDGGTLSARIPPGLAPGWYDLAVAGPFGRGLLANAVEILEAPVLVACPSTPTQVAVLQEFDVALDVENATAWTVSGAVADVQASGAIERIAGSAGAQDVPARGSARWQWRFRGSSPGAGTLAFSVSGTDPRTGAAVSATASAALEVKRPASIEIASLAASPDPANVAQDVFVEMVVSNSGGVGALAVVPSVAPDPAGAATWVEGPTPPSATVAPGGAATFAWRWHAAARGALWFTGTVAGEDALSGATVSGGPRDSAAIVVQRPATLDGDVAVPARVNLGQLFDVALAVSNVGDAVAAGVAADVSMSPAGFVAAGAAPPPVDLAGSSSATLTRRFEAVGIGAGTVTAVATGTDATDLRTLTLTRTGAVTIERPANLAVVAVLSPSGPLVPGPFELRMTVTNAGEALALGVVPGVPALLPGSTAGISPVSGPTRVAGDGDLSGNESVTFSWTFDAVLAGTLGIGVGATAVDANDRTTLTAAGPEVWTRIVRPASLGIASLVASPDPVNLAQDVFVEMVVTNSGGVDALAVAPSVSPDPSSPATCLAGPTPIAAAIEPDGVATFAWRWAGAALGPLRFTGTAAGVDALTATTVSAPPRGSAAIAVQRPAELVADVIAPARVNVGQLFDVALAVTNLGDAVAVGIDAELSVSPAGLVAAGAAPAPVDLAGSASTTLTRRFTAVGVGDGTVQAVASGTDATDLRALTLTRTKALAVELPADLAAVAALSPPAPLYPGRFELRMTVTNRGEAVALGVTPGVPSLLPGSTAAISPVTGPTRTSGDGDLSASETVAFSWTFDAVSAGTLGVAVHASAVDANDRTTLSAAAPEVWTQVVPQPEVQQVTADALGDGTQFGFVAAYGGNLVVGPTRRGTALVRWDPAGASSTALTLSFARDVTGNKSSNDATPPEAPYRSIGHTGCAKDALDGCGPDNEDGRGLLASFTLEGSEWLLLAGARSTGDFSYVYVTRGTGTALAFSYVDLTAFLGAQTRGISAWRVVGGRLYLGFPDNGGSRPYGTAVLRLPTTGAGLDAAAPEDAIDLRLDEAFKLAMTNERFETITMVDAIGDLGGRVYFLSDVGCIVSKVALPAVPADFADCSPAPSAAYDRNQSVAPVRQYDIEPSQKAWPQVAEWNGRLYAIRNLVHPTLGRAPQLWSCDPASGLDPGACEPGDWRLVAADATNLTRFGNANATAATLLVATPRHLYVGFDDAVGGVRIYRTSASAPLVPADFEGTGGCSAANDTCPGFGGNGLGAPAATTRILDAKALQIGGGTFVYVSAGNGTGPARVVRLPE